MDKDVLNNYFSMIDTDDPILQIKTLIDCVRDRLHEIIDTPRYTTVLINVLIDVKTCLHDQILDKKKLEEDFIQQIEEINFNETSQKILDITNKYYKNMEMINILNKQMDYIDSVIDILSFNQIGIYNNLSFCEKMHEKYIIKIKQKNEDDNAIYEDLIRRYKLIGKEIVEM